MSSQFHADYFFDLSSFAHSALFKDTEFVWEVFARFERYFKTQTLGNIEVDIPPGVTLENKELISIGKGTTLEAGAFIRGPCIIGPHNSIRHGAYIRGNVITGAKCVIGHATEVKDAIFLDGAHAAHLSYVGNSILGKEVNLGAGVKCANLKFDDSAVSVKVDGQKISTGLRKLGAIIGDGSELGCNSVTNPGTLIGKGVFWYPGINFGGFVPHQSIVRSQTEVSVLPQQQART